jgi:hypothetical protein
VRRVGDGAPEVDDLHHRSERKRNGAVDNEPESGASEGRVHPRKADAGARAPRTPRRFGRRGLGVRAGAWRASRRARRGGCDEGL